jgi:hypothetical protein
VFGPLLPSWETEWYRSGKAVIARDLSLRRSMAMKQQVPEFATVVSVEHAYLHCGSLHRTVQIVEKHPHAVHPPWRVHPIKRPCELISSAAESGQKGLSHCKNTEQPLCLSPKPKFR